MFIKMIPLLDETSYFTNTKKAVPIRMAFFIYVNSFMHLRIKWRKYLLVTNINAYQTTNTSHIR